MLSSSWTALGARDDEELVRAVPAHHDVLGEVAPDGIGDRQQDVVAGPVAMEIVEQPEVVDVDERDADGRPGGAGRLDLRREVVDEGAVVQRLGQRVEPGRVDQRRRLPTDRLVR